MGKASSRKRIARDPMTGKFDESSPLNDPEILAYALKTKAAIEHLEPLLAALAKHSDDLMKSRGVTVMGYFLSGLKESINDQLEPYRKPHWSDVPAHIRGTRPYSTLSVDGERVAFRAPEHLKNVEVPQ